MKSRIDDEKLTSTQNLPASLSLNFSVPKSWSRFSLAAWHGASPIPPQFVAQDQRILKRVFYFYFIDVSG